MILRLLSSLVLFLAFGRAQDVPPFSAYATDSGTVAVARGAEDYFRLSFVAWGPNWAWTGIDGKLASQQGEAVGTFKAKLGGTGVPIRLGFRGSSPDPTHLRFQYELVADADTKLTLVILEFAPGKVFEGSDVLVEAEGKATRVSYPFAKRGLGKQVSSIRLVDPAGRVTTIRIDPASDISSDGGGRIILAQDQLAAHQDRRLSLDVELPENVRWYASAADVPDPAGFDKWYPWQGTGDTRGSVLSLADWLEAPAGKHGRITRQLDKLMYQGKPIKLWGLNLCYGACAPERALAEKRSNFYRNFGVNAVRLHKWADGSDWSGIQSKDSCVEFDPAGLDRMDYQVAKFKEAGIYVKLSAHFGSLKLGPSDKQYVPFLEEFGTFKNNRVETPHSAIHYSPELQEVQALQVVRLLKHRNPYTGLTYAEDPAVAFVEIINEQSILFYTSMAPLKASATLRRQTGQRFCAWLKQKYGSHEKLLSAWGASAMDCFGGDGFKAEGGEHLDRNNILPLGNPWYWDPAQLGGSQAPKKRRLLDTLHFLYTLECQFYDKYVQDMRAAGYEGDIVGSNWQAGRAFSHFANLHADARVGTVDRHNYFGENRANASMLTRAGSGLLSSGMQQVSDRPFMLSEWIHVYPNEWGVEGPAILGAYGMGLQGWDVSFLFQNSDNGVFSTRLGTAQWDVVVPQLMGLFPVLARQIHRGDVREAEVVAVRNVHVPSLFEGKLGFDDLVEQGYDAKELDSSKVPARALAVARSVVAFTEKDANTPVFDLKRYENEGQLVASTGQLRWQEAASGAEGGYFTMDTEATKAVVGYAAGKKHTLGGVTIECESPFAAIYVTAVEPDQNLNTSAQLLVVAIARARNSGMKFSPAGDKLLSPGTAPILMEPVKAKITLRRTSTPKVLVLDHDGRVMDRTVPVEQGAIELDGARDRTPYYLIRM